MKDGTKTTVKNGYFSLSLSLALSLSLSLTLCLLVRLVSSQPLPLSLPLLYHIYLLCLFFPPRVPLLASCSSVIPALPSSHEDDADAAPPPPPEAAGRRRRRPARKQGRVLHSLLLFLFPCLLDLRHYRSPLSPLSPSPPTYSSTVDARVLW